MESMSFSDDPLIVDLGGDSMQRKIDYANALNERLAADLNKSRLFNTSLRRLFGDAHKAVLWAINVMADGDYKRVSKDVMQTPDLLRGIGVVCVIIGVAGSVIMEAL